jgi:hypothetical protein
MHSAKVDHPQYLCSDARAEFETGHSAFGRFRPDGPAASVIHLLHLKTTVSTFNFCLDVFLRYQESPPLLRPNLNEIGCMTGRMDARLLLG